MRLGTFALGLCVVALASGACAPLQYTKAHEGQANGAAGTLYFLRVDEASVGVAPIGGTRTVKVARYSPGIVQCAKFPALPEESNVELRAGFSIPSDRCTGLAPDPVELVSASCPEGACSVTSALEGDVVVLRVSAKEARATKLDVTLKNRAGETFTDSVAIGFAKAGRIALRGAAVLDVPLVVGAEMYVPEARLLDEKGDEMSIDDDAIVRVQTGDALSRPENDVRMNAVAPGKTTLTWEVAGVLRREATVEVVAPSEVRELQALAEPRSTTALGDEEKPYWITDAPVARIDGSSREQTSVAVVALLRDGRRASVALTSAELLPKALGSAQAYETGSFVVFPASPPVVGEGSVSVRAGAIEGRFDIVMH